MVSFVDTADYPWGMDGGTYEGVALRTNLNAALLLKSGSGAPVVSGVLPGGGGLGVTATGGMTVGVSTGYCAIQSSSGSTFGGYMLGLTTAATLGVAAADPTNPRIDLVCMTVTDDGTSASTGEVQIITGTPSATPSAPALPNTSPNSSTELYTVAVAANATSITSGNLTDQRSFTAATGGIVPVQSLGQAPAGYTGLYVHDRSTGRLAHDPSGGPAQPILLPWAPAVAATTTPVTNSGSETQILTTSITTTGVEDIKIFASWPGILVNSSGGQDMSATMRLKIDSTQVGTMYAYNPKNDGGIRGGAELTHYTSSALGDTPSAGTHTIKWTFVQTYGGSLNVEVFAASYAPLFLRCEPVNL